MLKHSKKPADTHLLAEHFRCHPSQIVFVGDRLTTDIVYANKMSALSIFVTKVVSLKGDNPWAIRIRKLEHVLVSIQQYFGITKPHPKVKDIKSIVTIPK